MHFNVYLLRSEVWLFQHSAIYSKYQLKQMPEALVYYKDLKLPSVIHCPLRWWTRNCFFLNGTLFNVKLVLYSIKVAALKTWCEIPGLWKSNPGKTDAVLESMCSWGGGEGVSGVKMVVKSWFVHGVNCSWSWYFCSWYSSFPLP